MTLKRDWLTILTTSTLTDAEIARREGVTRAAVSAQRGRLRLPSTARHASKTTTVRFSGFSRDLLDALHKFADDEKTTLVEVVQRACRAMIDQQGKA
jgi:hypothetical protein